MPGKRKKTLTFTRITFEDFTKYFALESPGWRLALEAEAAGELDTALNKLEAVVLFNELYMSNLENQIMRALLPYGTGTIEKYFEMDQDSRADYLISFIGNDRAGTILKEAVVETRNQAHIGQNDKVKKPTP